MYINNDSRQDFDTVQTLPFLSLKVDPLFDLFVSKKCNLFLKPFFISNTNAKKRLQKKVTFFGHQKVTKTTVFFYLKVSFLEKKVLFLSIKTY